jgi:hypothetical protein
VLIAVLWSLAALAAVLLVGGGISWLADSLKGTFVPGLLGFLAVVTILVLAVVGAFHLWMRHRGEL